MLSLLYFILFLFEIEDDSDSVSILISSQTLVSSLDEIVSFKVLQHLFLIDESSFNFTITPPMILSRSWNDVSRKISLHVFCKFGDSVHKDRLNFNAKSLDIFDLLYSFVRTLYDECILLSFFRCLIDFFLIVFRSGSQAFQMM